MHIDDLRRQHPRFTYRRYRVSHADGALHIGFEFVTDPDIAFTPTVTIPGVSAEVYAACPPGVLHNLAFHLGMIEIPSYWKATCSPQIVVAAAPLHPQQVAWWHTLLLHGMTEFFYVNAIDFTAPDFVTIVAQPPDQPDQTDQPPVFQRDERTPAPQRILVPVGGGKDSVVTIETLARLPVEIGYLALNPMQAARDIVAISQRQRAAAHPGQANGATHPDSSERPAGTDIVIRRTIDSNLLRLNEAGYLNGHTPFSALVAFLSVTCAVLFGYGRVALSYERSSNEGNVSYRGCEINHQYSKTFDFEQRFRAYVQTYLAPGIDFFSFLRPLYEVQIARLFVGYHQYHTTFRSCNRGLKSNTWCFDCPKCLFVFTALFPFMSEAAHRSIFAEDLFARADLAEIAWGLLDPARQKPFECVGTHEESLVLFWLCVRRLRSQPGRADQPLPPLLDLVEAHYLRREPDMEARAAQLLASWNAEHALPPELADWLHQAVAQQAPLPGVGDLSQEA